MRQVAFYLPQFYPTPENDLWWGPGFTEWSKVTSARPLFGDHEQPHLPGELGFYDLRLPEVRQAQADLAAAHGISAFCYYHYWFHGRRVLDLPFDEVLRSGRPELPFCLAWANADWTRAWDGVSGEVLLEQTYSSLDDLRHIRWLCGAFSDPRYLRVDGKPVFLVAQGSHLPDPRRMTDIWRSEAARLGVGDLYLLRMDLLPADRGDPTELGFDAAVEFQPDTIRLGARLTTGEVRDQRGLEVARQEHELLSYPALVEAALSPDNVVGYKRFPCVAPSWDNSARRAQNARVFHGSTPVLYERWLHEILRRFEPFTPDEDLVFVNAWNEWAEGCHLEPDRRWGRRYLQAHLVTGRPEDHQS